MAQGTGWQAGSVSPYNTTCTAENVNLHILEQFNGPWPSQPTAWIIRFCLCLTLKFISSPLPHLFCDINYCHWYVVVPLGKVVLVISIDCVKNYYWFQTLGPSALRVMIIIFKLLQNKRTWKKHFNISIYFANYL